MKLIEESYHIWNSNEIETPLYIKKYDDDGKLIYLEEYEIDESSFTSFLYDKTGRLKEELISINRPYGTLGEELKKEYVYNDIGYSILITQLREIHDSSTSEKFKGGLILPEDYSSEHPKETNRLVCVEEFSLTKSGHVFTVKTHNLTSNSIELKQYEYQENCNCTFYYSLIGTVKKLEKKLVQEFDENKRITLEREIIYNEGSETNTRCVEYTYWKTDDYYQINYKTTKTDDGLEVIEKFDSYGNVLQMTNNYGDRTIYLNEYNEANLLKSSIGINIQNDYHNLSCKRLLKYR